MMRPCEKCLENNWDYKYIDGWIRATCNLCGYEVEFMSGKLKKKEQCKEAVAQGTTQ